MRINYIINRLYSIINQNYLLFLFITAAIARSIGVIFLLSTRGIFLEADAADYIAYAKAILNQGPFVKDIENLIVNFGPGFPFILSFNYLLSGTDNYYFFFALNVLLSSLTVVYIYKTAIISTNNRFVSISASLWALLYIQYFWYNHLILKETIVFFLVIYIVYLILVIKREKSNHYFRILTLIIAYTILMHIDERYFFYSPFIITYILCNSNEKKLQWQKALLFFVGVIILTLPWSYRNYLVYKRPIILTERIAKITDKVLGYENAIYTHGKNVVRPQRNNLQFYEELRDSIMSNNEVKSKNVKYLDLMKVGIDNGDIPKRKSWIETKISYFIEFWRPFRFSNNYYGTGFRYMIKWSAQRNITGIIQYGILIPLLISGIYYSIKERNKALILIAILIILHSLIHIFIAHAIERYRIPIDSLIFILAFYGAYNLKRYYKIMAI